MLWNRNFARNEGGAGLLQIKDMGPPSQRWGGGGMCWQPQQLPKGCVGALGLVSLVAGMRSDVAMETQPGSLTMALEPWAL